MKSVMRRRNYRPSTEAFRLSDKKQTYVVPIRLADAAFAAMPGLIRRPYNLGGEDSQRTVIYADFTDIGDAARFAEWLSDQGVIAQTPDEYHGHTLDSRFLTP